MRKASRVTVSGSIGFWRQITSESRLGRAGRYARASLAGDLIHVAELVSICRQPGRCDQSRSPIGPVYQNQLEFYRRAFFGVVPRIRLNCRVR